MTPKGIPILLQQKSIPMEDFTTAPCPSGLCNSHVQGVIDLVEKSLYASSVRAHRGLQRHLHQVKTKAFDPVDASQRTLDHGLRCHPPNRVSSSFSRDPALTPIRMGALRDFASRTIAFSRSFPRYSGVNAKPVRLPSALHRQSVMEMDVCNERDMNLLLNFSDGPGGFLIDHSDRMISQPASRDDGSGRRSSYVTCIVFVMDWTETGASPPILTEPSEIWRVFLR